MKIVVLGGTGLIGLKLVDKLRNSDHLVIAASPQTGVDTITLNGLYEVLQQADVVVDVTNSPSLTGADPLDFFQRSTMNLVTAAAYARAKHYVVLSIVGSDRLPESDYLRAKLAQEELIKESGIPYTILRSTQFFELAERIVDLSAKGSEVHISPAAIQPIAGDELVKTMETIIFGSPANATVEVAGPVMMPMFEFIRYYMTSIEDTRQLIPDKDARYLGAVLNDQSLIPGKNPVLGKIRYEDWFRQQTITA